jgi:hypothetical protein
MKILLLFLASLPAFAQCGRMVLNPSTGRMDCIGNPGGANVYASSYGAVTSLAINLTPLALANTNGLLVECWSGTTTLAPVTITSLSSISTTSVTANFTSTANVICKANATGGAVGPAGTSVTATVESPGSNCTNGGVKFVSASGTNYACNGAAGAAGSNGTNGTNGSPGAAGSNGTNGQSVTVTAESAGANCTYGGEKLVSVSGTAYVCNGASGANGTNGTNGTNGANGTNGTGYTYRGTYAGRPSTPATNDTMLFTDASVAGVCTAGNFGSGGNYAQCTWNGSSFLVTGGGAGITTMTTGSGAPSAACSVPSTANIAFYWDTAAKNMYYCANNTGPVWQKFATDGAGSGKTGALQWLGKTSGGAGFSVNDVAGTSILYLLPAANGAAGQILYDTGAATCPDLETAPTSCHQLAWTGALAAGALLLGGNTAAPTASADFVQTSHTLAGGASAILDMSAAPVTTGLKVPVAAGAAPTADGQIAVNSTTHRPAWGSNGSTISPVVTADLGSNVGTFLGTPSGANLASALTSALPNTKGGTGGDSSAQTGYAKVSSGTWSYGAIAQADLPVQDRTGRCELHIWGSGTSQALQATDDEPWSCINTSGVDWTVTGVICIANAGTTTSTTPILTGGSATSVLSSALTCGNNAFAGAAVNGTPTIHSATAAGVCSSTPCSIDANITVADASTTNVRIVITYTY